MGEREKMAILIEAREGEAVARLDSLPPRWPCLREYAILKRTLEVLISCKYGAWDAEK